MENIISANQKLNNWCGTEGVNFYEGDTALGLLFKYAIPKLQDNGYQIDIVCFEHKGFSVALFNVINLREDIIEVKDDTPALALFWAIQEVIQ